MRFSPAELFLVVALLALSSCDKSAGTAHDDPNLATRGTIEITARLVEIPEGAIFQRDLYDYATILKYEVLAGHRGNLKKGEMIYVAQYNPWKPRAEAAGSRARDIGGNLRQFRAGQVVRMALDVPLDDHFMGGVVDKYFGKHTGPIYWAAWTNAAD